MKKTVGQRIGRYVRHQRLKNRTTLSELAKKSNLTTSFILRLEKEHYDSVSFEVIENISRGFGMDLVDFLHKCELTDKNQKLPSLEFYLQEKYNLPKEAVSEIEAYVQFILAKYKESIEKQKWQNKKFLAKK